MTDEIEAQEVYCPTCDTDYRVAYVESDDELVVVCDCDEAQPLAALADQFVDGVDAPDGRGFQ